MRYLVLLTNPSTPPTGSAFGEELARAGVLLADDGPARGSWLIQVRSEDEALAWAARCGHPDEVVVRLVAP